MCDVGQNLLKCVNPKTFKGIFEPPFTFLNVISGHSVMQNLPSAVQTICETWNSIHTNEFPNIGSWVREQRFLCLETVRSYVTSHYSPDDHNIPDAHTMLNMTAVLTLNAALRCLMSFMYY